MHTNDQAANAETSYVVSTRVVLWVLMRYVHLFTHGGEFLQLKIDGAILETIAPPYPLHRLR